MNSLTNSHNLTIVRAQNKRIIATGKIDSTLKIEQCVENGIFGTVESETKSSNFNGLFNFSSLVSPTYLKRIIWNLRFE